MSEYRPTSIIVIGLLNLAIGCFGVAWNGAGAISLFAGKELAREHFTSAELAEMKSQQHGLSRDVPHWPVYSLVVMQLVPWMLTLCLFVSGVGLLRCRPGARRLSLLYAVVSILHKIGMAVYTYVFLLPVYKTPIAVQELTKPHLVLGADVAANIMSIVAPLLLMTYPLLVLIVMYRRPVVAALTTRPSPAPAIA